MNTFLWNCSIISFIEISLSILTTNHPPSVFGIYFSFQSVSGVYVSSLLQFVFEVYVSSQIQFVFQIPFVFWVYASLQVYALPFVVICTNLYNLFPCDFSFLKKSLFLPLSYRNQDNSRRDNE